MTDLTPSPDAAVGVLDPPLPLIAAPSGNGAGIPPAWRGRIDSKFRAMIFQPLVGRLHRDTPKDQLRRLSDEATHRRFSLPENLPNCGPHNPTAG